MRSGDADGDLIVKYTVSGTATAGIDYNSLSGTVTIPHGSVSATFSVTPINDSDAEGSETVIAALSTATTYYVGTQSSDAVSIVDNEAALTVSIQLRPAFLIPRSTGWSTNGPTQALPAERIACI
jgi:hypothetical protein